MKILQELQSKYFKLIQNKLKISALSYVPENASFPLIKFGNITVNKWLITPMSNIVQIDFEIYSNKATNTEIFKIMNDLEELITKEKPSLSKFTIVKQEINDKKLIPYDD